MTLGLSIIPDPRPGRPAYDAVILQGHDVIDKRRFEDRAQAERWARRRIFELFPQLLTLKERIESAGYTVRTEPAPRDGETGWYAIAKAYGKTVGVGYGETEDAALRDLAGELGLEVPR